MYILTSKYFPTDYWPDAYFPALPEGADIQYTEVMEFAVCIATSAGFSVVLPNDESEDYSDTTSMIVAGAGTTDVNGTYTEDGTYNSKPKYRKSGMILILWESNSWRIINAGYAQYDSSNNVATPNLVTNWEKSWGDLPVPTVTAPIVPTLTEVAAFTLEMPMVVEIETYEELTA